MKPATDALFLDFDGVICDSLRECFYSSWIAWQRLRDRPVPDRIEMATWSLFRSYRPFIRAGEDFLLLQESISRGVGLATQSDFDIEVSRSGTDRMHRYREAIYAIRDELTTSHLSDWARLHRIYPLFRELLPRLARHPAVFILSTKRRDFIEIILRSSGLSWPSDRILTALDRSKLEMIEEWRSPQTVARPILLDDHRDHLLTRSQSTERGIDCYLADWGYAAPEWLLDKRYAIISTERARRLFGRFTDASPK